MPPSLPEEEEEEEKAEKEIPTPSQEVVVPDESIQDMMMKSQKQQDKPV